MAEQVTQGDLVLAGGGKLGPVSCDWRIQFQLALTTNCKAVTAVKVLVQENRLRMVSLCQAC